MKKPKQQNSTELRVQPHNIEAEEGLLAACLIDGGLEILSKLIELKVQPEFFYNTAHEEIFRALLALYETGEPIDEILLLEYLRKNGLEDEVGGISAIYAIQARIETSAHALYFSKIVHEKYLLRRLIRTSREVIEAAYEQAVELPALVERLEGEARTIGESAASEREIESAEEVVSTQLAEKAKRETAPDIQKISVQTNLSNLNEALPRKQLLPGHMIVIAARPSIGKTSLALNILDQVSVEDHIPAFVVSLEMTPEELVNRMESSRSRVNTRDVDDDVLDSTDQARLDIATTQIRRSPLYIDSNPQNTIATIRAKARNLANRLSRRGERLGLIVIDYLQLISGTDSKAHREQQISEISRGVKTLALELKLPVIVLSQLNRATERENRAPRLSDLRESGSIEQDADVVLLMHRAPGEADIPDTAFEETIKINLAKVRNGPTGEILTRFQSPFTRFIDCD